jgi:transposase-like protein
MQVNVLGAERRRRWSYDEKVRFVEETLQPGETVCGVARRHGVAHSLLFTWRRQARQGRLGGDPQAWLTDILARIAAHPAHRLDELLPWNWAPAAEIARKRRDLRADDDAP